MHAVSALLVTLALTQAAAAKPGFKSPYLLEDMRGKQAVVETDMGTFVLALLPEVAPNHVGYFMKLVSEGVYSGTTFHRVIKYGIIQGGDPLSKDLAKAAQYGTGGLNVLAPEFNKEPFTAGTVGGVLVPGEPASAGSQFFIAATDQRALDGQYTVFARVVDGLEVVQQISAVEANGETPTRRIAIRSVTIRDTPPVPFVNDSAEQLGRYRVALETTMGAVELEMLAGVAPETVRQFLRLTEAGVYDDTLVHRVAPGFVIQTGALAFKRTPITASQQVLVRDLQPEFSDTPNVPGVVSMARGEDPASASTSFFICIGECRSLDGKYTVFARVTSGMEVVTGMASVALDGEAPREPIVIVTARVRRP